MALVSTPFLHAGELVSTNGVEILAVDGKKVKQHLFSSDKLEVDDGPHQVAVMYKGQFKNSDIISSKIHIFDIDTQGDTEISIKRFGNSMQAKNAINKGIEWIVKNDEKTTMVTNSDIISGEGLFPNSNVEKLISDYNQQHNITVQTEAAPATLAMPAATVPALTTTTATTTINTSNTALLIETYQKASKQEQKAFRMWLLEQDMK